MVEFFLLTGDFSSVMQVINELPAPIETDYTCYDMPAELIVPYIEYLQEVFEKPVAEPAFSVITPEGKELDSWTARLSMMRQHVLTAELEQINSKMCTPCDCRLCCVGPDEEMKQAFFEIPLAEKETELFPVEKISTPESVSTAAMNEPALECDGFPFYAREHPVCICWHNGWSLILPKKASCPNLEPESGRCLVYADRPAVCRRPQIFPYILEPVAGRLADKPVYRLRQSVLAVIDCPYVSLLQSEIAAYAAACELDIVFSRNKE